MIDFKMQSILCISVNPCFINDSREKRRKRNEETEKKHSRCLAALFGLPAITCEFQVSYIPSMIAGRRGNQETGSVRTPASNSLIDTFTYSPAATLLHKSYA
jgi:hypothetical protein